MSTFPAESWAITDDYKQSIYDPRQNKIGDVDDVLDRAGKLAALLVGAGGFLGVAEKDVAVVLGGEERQQERQAVAYSG